MMIKLSVLEIFLGGIVKFVLWDFIFYSVNSEEKEQPYSILTLKHLRKMT